MKKSIFIIVLVSLFVSTVFAGRYYDPEIGRFTQIDPKWEKYPSTSPYAYCLNNPLKYIDPDGKETISIGVAAMLQNVGYAGQAAVGVTFDSKGNVGIELTMSHSPLKEFSGLGIGYSAGIYGKFSSAETIFNTAGEGGTFGGFAGAGPGGAFEFNNYLSTTSDGGYSQDAWGITGSFGAFGAGVYSMHDYTVVAGASAKQILSVLANIASNSMAMIGEDGSLFFIAQNGDLINTGIIFQIDWNCITNENEDENNEEER